MLKIWARSIPENPPKAEMEVHARIASKKAGNATKEMDGTKEDAYFLEPSIVELAHAAAKANAIPA